MAGGVDLNRIKKVRGESARFEAWCSNPFCLASLHAVNHPSHWGKRLGAQGVQQGQGNIGAAGQTRQ